VAYVRFKTPPTGTGGLDGLQPHRLPDGFVSYCLPGGFVVCVRLQTAPTGTGIGRVCNRTVCRMGLCLTCGSKPHLRAPGFGWFVTARFAGWACGLRAVTNRTYRRLQTAPTGGSKLRPRHSSLKAPAHTPAASVASAFLLPKNVPGIRSRAPDRAILRPTLFHPVTSALLPRPHSRQ